GRAAIDPCSDVLRERLRAPYGDCRRTWRDGDTGRCRGHVDAKQGRHAAAGIAYVRAVELTVDRHQILIRGRHRTAAEAARQTRRGRAATSASRRVRPSRSSVRLEGNGLTGAQRGGIDPYLVKSSGRESEPAGIERPGRAIR